MVDKIILELPADTVGGDILVSTETRERAEAAAAQAEATVSGMLVSGTVDGDNLVLTKADSTTVVAGNVRGPKGDDGSNVLPTDEAIAQAISTDGSETQTQLNATIGASAMSLARRVPPAPSPRQTLTRFKTGHGWTLGGAGAWGTGPGAGYGQSVELTTDGVGGVGTAEVYFTARDMSAESLVIWLQADQPSRVGLFQVELQYGGDWAPSLWRTQIHGNVNRLPIVDDRWSPYVLEPAIGSYNWITPPPALTDFEQITGIRVNLRDTAAGSTKIRLGAVEIADPPERFPNGAVIIGFDDGYKSQMLAREVMDEFGYPGTGYIITELLGTSGANEFMTVSDLKSMQKWSGWDFQHHSYLNSVHASTYTGVSPEVLDEDLRRGKEWGKSHGFDYEHLAYPLGYYNDAVIEIVDRYYSTSRTVLRHPRSLHGPIRPHEVSCYMTHGNLSLTELGWALSGIQASKIPAEIAFHRIHEGTGASPDSIGFTTGRLREFCQMIKDRGIPVITRAEAYR